MKFCTLPFFLSLIFFGLTLKADTVFDLGLGVTSFNYAEVVTPPLKSSQTGFLADFRASATEKFLDQDWLVAEKIDFALGSLEYDGSTQEPNVQAVTSEDFHYFFDFEIDVGRRLFSLFTDSFAESDLYFYAGADYFLWYRNLSNPAEIYKLFSIPFGFRLDPNHPHLGSIGLDISLRPMVSGSVSVTYSSSTGYDPLDVPVTFAMGFRAQLPVYVFASEKCRVNLTPWVQTMDLGQGAVVPVTSGGQQVSQNGQILGVTEPSSHTVEYGVFAAFEYVL